MPAARTATPERPGRSGSTWGYRTARALAYLINPLILPPLLFGLVLAHYGATTAEIGRVTGVATACFGLAPLGCVLWMLKRRRAASIELHDQRRRTVPFLVGAAASAAALPLLYMLGTTALPLVLALAGCHLVNTLLLMLINLRWKISLHTAAVASFVSILLFVTHTAALSLPAAPADLLRPAPVYGLLPLVPLLMWARYRTGAHTQAQVLGGALFGLVVPYGELLACTQLGLLTDMLPVL